MIAELGKIVLPLAIVPTLKVGLKSVLPVFVKVNVLDLLNPFATVRLGLVELNPAAGLTVTLIGKLSVTDEFVVTVAVI